MISKADLIDEMHEFVDSEYSVVPTISQWDESKGLFSGKICKERDWNRFSKQLTTTDDVETWRGNGVITGFGVVLGVASNICCIDVDKDDAVLMAALPHSPCVKIGEKGETRFYRLYDQYAITRDLPTHNMKIFKIDGKAAIEIFYSNKYTVVPPSMHSYREGEDPLYYRWFGESLKDIDKDALPVLDWRKAEQIAQGLVNKKAAYRGPDEPLKLVETEDVGQAGERWNDMQAYMSQLLREGVDISRAATLIEQRDRERNKYNPFLLDHSKIGKNIKDTPWLTAMSVYSDFFLSTQQGKQEHEIEKPLLASVMGLTNSQEWLPPIPIKAGYKTEFPLEIIPPVLGDWLSIEAQNLGIDLAPLFCQAIAVISGLIGNKVRIYPKQHDTTWYEVPNLWVIYVAEPGRKKSPMTAILNGPLKIIEEKLKEKQNAEITAFNNLKRVADSRIKALKKDLDKETDKPTRDEKKIEKITEEHNALVLSIVNEPKHTPKVVENITPERLIQIFDNSPTGLILRFNELSTLISKFNKKGAEDLRPLIISSADGKNPYSYETKHQGAFHIEELCAALVGNVQPGVLADKVMTGKGGDHDGFIERAIIIYDDAKKAKHIDMKVPDDIKELGYNVFTCADSIGQGEEVRFSASAQSDLVAYLDGIEDQLLDERNRPIFSFIGKFRGLAIKLAYMFQFLKSYQDGKAEHFDKIGVDALASAIKFLEFNRESIKLVQSEPYLATSRLLTDMFRDGRIEPEITMRDLTRQYSKFIGPPKQWNIVKQILLDHNIIKVVLSGKSRVILVNPDLLRGE